MRENLPKTMNGGKVLVGLLQNSLKLGVTHLCISSISEAKQKTTVGQILVVCILFVSHL